MIEVFGTVQSKSSFSESLEEVYERMRERAPSYGNPALIESLLYVCDGA